MTYSMPYAWFWFFSPLHISFTKIEKCSDRKRHQNRPKYIDRSDVHRQIESIANVCYIFRFSRPYTRHTLSSSAHLCRHFFSIRKFILFLRTVTCIPNRAQIKWKSTRKKKKNEATREFLAFDRTSRAFAFFFGCLPAMRIALHSMPEFSTE